ncbi:hypothetical protein EJB05_22954, partial [Eragrostis curvula]
MDVVVETVARINGELSGAEDGEAVLESLRQLQTVQMTFAALEATKVARAVNALRKSASSEEAREVAAALYWAWKALALDHLRSVRNNKAPPVKARRAAGSSAGRGKAKVARTTSSADTATLRKQRSEAPSKTEQRPVVARQRVVGKNTAAARPKPAPASKPSTSGSTSTAASAAANTAANKRVAPPSVAPTRKANMPAQPQKPTSGSSVAGKRKEAPTSFDEASLERAKRRLRERYQEAMAVKEKRTIQVINAPGKSKAQQRPVVVGRHQVQCTPAAGTEKQMC